MKNDNRKNILLRYSIVIFIIVVTATAVLVKLVNTTIVDARNWDKKAAEELSKTTVIQPERGNILAADGSVLAANLRFYTVRLDFRSEQFNIKRYINAIDSIADSMALAFPRRNSDQWKDYLLKPLTVKDKKKRDRFVSGGHEYNLRRAPATEEIPFLRPAQPQPQRNDRRRLYAPRQSLRIDGAPLDRRSGGGLEPSGSWNLGTRDGSRHVAFRQTGAGASRSDDAQHGAVDRHSSRAGLRYYDDHRRQRSGYR